MMQLHLRIGSQEAQRQGAHARELHGDVVGIEPAVSDRHEIGLRQPGNAACGAQMHERAIG